MEPKKQINSEQKYQLAVVMPVYNEEACIVGVVEEWRSVLRDLKISYIMIVINDGSKDGTADKLSIYNDQVDIRVINKPNSGHGPTILSGYKQAVQIADWVFQTDSDGEIPAESFTSFWQRRENYDALFGIRSNRRQPLSRKIISLVSRLLVYTFCGRHVTDVNTPFRLMRSSVLTELLPAIPDQVFAPNLILSGLFSKKKVRIFNTPVPHQNRRTGTVSIKKWKLLKSAVRSFGQSIRVLATTK